ncbi:oxidoreductase [Bacillus coahuilensis m2-6]|nr:oxidoreductase [Bacillus coahuilensis m2-6]
MKRKNIVITGASGGIGAEMALLCAKSGANVAIMARNKEKLQEIKRKMGDKTQVLVYQLDVSDTNQVEQVFSKVLTEWTHVDVLINNAGYGIFAHADEAKMEDVSGMFSVNVLGLIACTKAVLPSMKKEKKVRLLIIASVAGKLSTPKSTAYSSTKHAVLGFTNGLRMELAPYGIKLMAVNPGPIQTNFFDVADESGEYVKNIKRFMLDPQTVAKSVVNKLLTNTREITLPRWMGAGAFFYSLMPGVVEKLGGRAFNKNKF